MRVVPGKPVVKQKHLSPAKAAEMPRGSSRSAPGEAPRETAACPLSPLIKIPEVMRPEH